MIFDAGSRPYSLRAVLAEDGTPHACARRIGGFVEQSFGKSGINFELPIFSEDRPNFLRWSWQKPEFPVWVQLVDDQEGEVRWITLQSAEIAKLEQFGEDFLRNLKIKSLEQLIGETSSSKPTSYTRLALGVNGAPREDIVRILALGLADQNVETRRRAGEAVFILNWHQFRPYVEMAWQREIIPAVKAGLAAWLQRDAANS